METMDINTVAVSGCVFDMGLNPTLKNEFGVAEGKVSVCVGSDKEGVVYDEFYIRAYGKKALFVSKLKDGTMVCISGRLREDIRVNNTGVGTRSKTYINIDVISVVDEKGGSND